MPSIGDGDLLDDLDDMMIFPLTDLDGDDNNNNNSGNSGNRKVVVDDDDDDDEDVVDDYDEDNNGDSFGRRVTPRGASSLQHDSGGLFENGFHGGFSSGFSRPRPAHHQQPRTAVLSRSIPLKINANHHDLCGSSSPKVNWMQAMKKIKHLKDPWERYRLTELASETATRHRYHALKKIWVTDKVEVKVEKESFDQGAMRACHRVKKLSSFSRSHDWRHAQNYVAKRYIRDDVAREVYFEDVRLQMDAKLWGEEFNRHNPPKKVDVFQMCVLEFEGRPPGDRFYHLEHFIEGHYIKYNSNSGFVDENTRFTPQAFSHFTFERSGHHLIVIDIQGVGDLWTDPQIHTSEGKEYGDGNLGVKGMALFFHSHVCNSICESLGLSRFDMAPSEERLTEKLLQRLKSSSTCIRGDEEPCGVPASPLERSHFRMFFERHRRMSTCSSVMSEETSELSEDDLNGDISPRCEDYFGSPMITSPLRHRQRFLSESEESSLSVTRSEEEDRMKFQLASSNAARPACVEHEINLRNLQNHRRLSDSVLGLIHHELAKYHEMGRFVGKTDPPDLSAAMFHEQFAADLGVKEAMLTLASIYFGLMHEVLVNVTLETTEANTKKGFEYMAMAANAGDRYAMLHLARAYETGTALDSSPDGQKSYSLAVEWYSVAAGMVQEDESGEYDAIMDTPLYELKAKMAELYLEGGYGLEKDASYAGDLYTEAAECATAAMKGRTANKYYALAEEAYAQMDE